jgi:Holliday junction resolvase
MSQRESQLSRKIMQALRAEGVFCFKIHGGPTMMSGLPDIIACVDGHFVGMETKLPETRNNTSPRQEYVHELIGQSGGTAQVVCSAREALKIVRELRENALEVDDRA